MIVSHRVLRYAAPFLHLAALGTRPARAATALLCLAALPGRGRGSLIARYYVLTQASVALGLYDWLRRGTEAGWSAAEGTR
jgi:hypothetical protein